MSSGPIGSGRQVRPAPSRSAVENCTALGILHFGTSLFTNLMAKLISLPLPHPNMSPNCVTITCLTFVCASSSCRTKAKFSRTTIASAPEIR